MFLLCMMGIKNYTTKIWFYWQNTQWNNIFVVFVFSCSPLQNGIMILWEDHSQKNNLKHTGGVNSKLEVRIVSPKFN